MADTDSSISSLASVGRGAALFTGGKLASQAFGFLAVAILTNTLGAERYGVYAFATTIIALTGSIANLGSDKAILRFLPIKDTQQSTYWSFSVLISLLGGGAACVLLFTLAPVINTHTINHSLFPTTLRVFTILLLANIALQMSRSAFRALDRPELTTVAHQFVHPGLKVTIFGLLAAVTASYMTILLGLIAATLIAAALGIAILLAKTPIKLTWPTEIAVRDYLDFSLPSAIKDVGSLLYTRIDILMLGALATASGIGVYQVAIVLGAVVALPLSGMNQIFPAIASKLYSDGNHAELERVFSSVTRWTVTVSLPIVIGVVVYRTEILSIMGEDFTDGGIVLSILLLGQFVNTAVGPSGFLLMMTDHQRLVMLNQWVFGVVNVGLNYVLITRAGITGAAVATTITLISLNITRLVEISVLEGWFPYTRAFVKPATAALAMTIILFGVKYVFSGLSGLIAGAIFGGLTFFAVLHLAGVSDTDRLVYKKIREST